jgi:hypothetical protein
MVRSPAQHAAPAKHGANRDDPLQDALRLVWNQTTHCRECNQPVSLLEKICPRCGTPNPVIISVRPLAMPVAVVLCTAMLLILAAL